MSALTRPRPIPLHEKPTITDRAMYEIVDGQLVEMEKMSLYSVSVAGLIFAAIHNHAVAHKLGQAVIELLFNLPLAKPRSRRPDVAFVSAERWPLDKPLPVAQNAWDVVPDLAVEVVSPHDRAEKLERKLNEYFDAGVMRVWVVFPQNKIIKVYKSRYEIQVFQSGEELIDEAVLPGFRLRVSSIFPPQLALSEERKPS